MHSLSTELKFDFHRYEVAEIKGQPMNRYQVNIFEAASWAGGMNIKYERVLLGIGIACVEIFQRFFHVLDQPSFLLPVAARNRNLLRYDVRQLTTTGLFGFLCCRIFLLFEFLSVFVVRVEASPQMMKLETR